MRTAGPAGLTTKAIASGARCSEATLYKQFADKEDLLACVLRGRLSAVAPLFSGPDTGTAEECCTHLARQALWFYEDALPLFHTLLADPGLLARHRALPHGTGRGPQELLDAVARRLELQRERGGIRADADVRAAAALLLGACSQQALLPRFVAEEEVQPAEEFVAAVARTVSAALCPGVAGNVCR